MDKIKEQLNDIIKELKELEKTLSAPYGSNTENNIQYQDQQYIIRKRKAVWRCIL